MLLARPLTLQQMNHDDRRLLHFSAADSLAPLINLALRRNDALAVFNHAVRVLWPACPISRHFICERLGACAC